MKIFEKKDKKDYEYLYKRELENRFYYEETAKSLKKELIEVKDQNEKLIKENETLKSKIDTLEWNNKMVSNYKKRDDDIIESLQLKIESLEREFLELNPKLKPSPKKVNKDMILDVKDMISQGNNYRVTSSKHKISTRTVSRIINGFYDDLLT